MANTLPTTMEYFDNLLGEQLTEGGGGGETWETVFEGSVTTEANGDNARAIVQGYDLSVDTIKVTFNGTEYVCEYSDVTGYGAGDDGDGNYDWSEYPFNITPRGGALIVVTEAAGTYSVKIEEPQSGGSSDFSTATVTVVYPSGVTNATVWGTFCISMSGIDASIPSVTTSGTYDMILYKGSGIVMSTLGAGRSVTVTGNAEDMGDGSYIVTGDCTITIS